MHHHENPTNNPLPVRVSAEVHQLAIESKFKPLMAWYTVQVGFKDARQCSLPKRNPFMVKLTRVG